MKFFCGRVNFCNLPRRSFQWSANCFFFFFFIKAKTDTAPAVETLPVDGREEMATGGDEVRSEDCGVLLFRTFESFHAYDDVVIVEPLL